MRVSVDERDPGFIRNSALYTVFIDGLALSGVITADDELGEVLCVDYDDAGQIVVAASGIEVAVKTLRGKVKIEKVAA
jgi:uncharacterized protein YuzE